MVIENQPSTVTVVDGAGVEVGVTRLPVLPRRGDAIWFGDACWILTEVVWESDGRETHAAARAIINA